MKSSPEKSTPQSLLAANAVYFVIAFVLLVVMSGYFFLCQDGHRKKESSKQEIYILKDEVADTGALLF